MRFYKIDIQGKMWLERLAIPGWTASDEGRLLYDTGNNVAYLGDNGGFGEIWTSRNDGAASGLDADLLDGQQGSFYQNASNLNAGIIPVARLTGSYNIDITGTATTAKYA
jgi:hypothetical protein